MKFPRYNDDVNQVLTINLATDYEASLRNIYSLWFLSAFRGHHDHFYVSKHHLNMNQIDPKH